MVYENGQRERNRISGMTGVFTLDNLEHPRLEVKAGEEKVVTYAARGPSGWLAGWLGSSYRRVRKRDGIIDGFRLLSSMTWVLYEFGSNGSSRLFHLFPILLPHSSFPTLLLVNLPLFPLPSSPSLTFLLHASILPLDSLE